MNQAIALFAYDFPHRKTHDFLLDLVALGVRNIVVLAAPKKALKHNDTKNYFPKRLRFSSPASTEELCTNLGLHYHRIEHENAEEIAYLQRAYGFKLGIISGARIIPKTVIGLFTEGIINFHPGKIPETSGLDAFFYTVKNSLPAGVTTHYIDHRVDAGNLISFDEVAVGPGDTPEVVLENGYQTQRTVLRRLIKQFQQERIESTEIQRPSKNDPMTLLEKLETLNQFEIWRSDRYVTQQNEALFAACENGLLADVHKILSVNPVLINTVNAQGWTPLIVASFHQRYEVVKFLLERGSDPNACGKKGTTVLMYAKTKLIGASSVDFRILDALFEAGAETARVDCFGKTVLEYVREANDSRLIAYFESKLR